MLKFEKANMPKCEQSPLAWRILRGDENFEKIFSELDISTRKKLIQFIPDDIQTIITTTDLKNIQKKIVEKAKIFIVDSGNITEKVE